MRALTGALPLLGMLPALVRAGEPARFGDPLAFEQAARASGLAGREPEAASLNARRMREAPAPARGLVVNIPAFKAYLLEEGRVVAQWRVVVGSPSTPTPELSSRIDAVVLNPAWSVPLGPPMRRVWEASRSSPTFLETSRMDVTFSSAGRPVPVPPEAWTDPADARYRVTQAPGPANPLGRVLFRFANPFGVWLHDTPERALFRRPERAYTLGCVRIEDPTALASRLLQGQGWAASRLERTAKTGETRIIRLDEPLELRFVYWTAWLEPEGAVGRARDIYGWDRGPRPSMKEPGAAVRCDAAEPPSE